MKRRTRILLFLASAAIAFVAAAAIHRKPAPSPSLSHKVFEVGQIADSGRVVFYDDCKSGFELTRDYAFILINFGDDKNPRPLYRLAVNASKSVISETDWNQFKAHLDKLPKGTVIDRYVTCMAPQSHGLPDSVEKQFESYCKERGLVIRDELDGRGNVICTCGKD